MVEVERTEMPWQEIGVIVNNNIGVIKEAANQQLTGVHLETAEANDSIFFCLSADRWSAYIVIVTCLASNF